MKSDVWSLGITLIEIALGRFPFADSDDGDDRDQYEYDLDGTLSPHRDSDPTVHPGRPLSMQPLSQSRRRSEMMDPKARRNSRGVSLEGGAMMMSILELLQHIVNEPAPRLVPENKFPKESHDFIDICLRKEPDQRPTPKELMVSTSLAFVSLLKSNDNPYQAHPWMSMTVVSNQVNLEAWAAGL